MFGEIVPKVNKEPLRALCPEWRRLEGEKMEAGKQVRGSHKNPVKGDGSLDSEETAQKPGVYGKK